MAFHDALETLALRDPRHIDPVLLREHIDGEGIPQVHLRHSPELGHLAFGRGSGFLEVS